MPQAKPVQFEGNTVFDRITAKASKESWARLPVGEIMGHVAQELVGTPYVGWTLERDEDREYCYVTLDGLDCVTFFESSLGLARAIRRGTPKPGALVQEVTLTRYWGGKPGDYLSRLHYTSDWMFDNARKGTVEDLTASLPGATRFVKKLTFMSDHVEVYRQLRAHPELLPRLSLIEESSSHRRKFYVPKAEAAKAELKFRTGDIIGITTTTPGMDCSHTGMILVLKGVPHFVHASSVAKKVMIDGRLSEYLSKQSSATGFMAVRPRDVK